MGALRVVSPEFGCSQPAAQLITLPIVLLALLKFSQFNIHLNRSRDDPNTWYFRFSPRTVLMVSDDGQWSWGRGPQHWRREIAPFLARAIAMLEDVRTDFSSVDQRPDTHERLSG